MSTPARQSRTLTVPEGLTGLRADSGLSRLLGLSRSAVAGLLDAGDITVDGRALRRSEPLPSQGWLEVLLPAPTQPPAAAPEPVPGMTVLHDDPDLVVVNKPVGVAVHASPGWSGPTVVGGLAAAGYRVSTSGAAERQGVVHRLDAGTSGVMVVAASERGYGKLKAAFKRREVDKTYHAVLQGRLDPLSGTIDAPIGRHPGKDWRFAVRADGKPSITHYQTLEAFRAASLVELKLQTGRTHQIRVHVAALSHPCAGDLTYGGDPVLANRLGLRRQWLHARRLGFAHPADGRWVEFEAAYPEDLSASLAQLRGQA